LLEKAGQRARRGTSRGHQVARILIEQYNLTYIGKQLPMRLTTGKARR